jgi:dihydrofolate reductase
MAKLVANMSMSLDGFIAEPSHSVGCLHDWYNTGEVSTSTANEDIEYRTSRASAEYVRAAVAEVGALLCGRRLFDLTEGWGGRHPVGAPAVVLTHSVPPGWPREGSDFRFITEGGIERAVEVASEIAGDRTVAVASANVAQQCLDAGLLDAIAVDLVPVLLGKGIPFFSGLVTAPVKLSDPRVVEGAGVTHLYYEVR